MIETPSKVFETSSKKILEIFLYFFLLYMLRMFKKIIIIIQFIWKKIKIVTGKNMDIFLDCNIFWNVCSIFFRITSLEQALCYVVSMPLTSLVHYPGFFKYFFMSCECPGKNSMCKQYFCYLYFNIICWNIIFFKHWNLK